MPKFYWGEPIDEVGLLTKSQTYTDTFTDLPSQKDLLELAKTSSYELATAVLYNSLLSHPRHGSFIRSVQQSHIDSNEMPHIKIGVLPGFFYKEFPETGASGRVFIEIAKRLGLKAELIATNSKGLVEDNAQTLKKWLSKQNEEHIWIFSLSRGALDMQHAIGHLLDKNQIQRIRIWLNINGFVKGTHLSDVRLNSVSRRLMTRLVCLWLKVPFRLAEQMSTTTKTLPSPKTIKAVNFVSLPLPQHIPTALLKRFKVLNQYGLNDGIATFHHRLIDDSDILPIWGQDHFCRGEQMSLIISKLISHLKRSSIE